MRIITEHGVYIIIIRWFVRLNWSHLYHIRNENVFFLLCVFHTSANPAKYSTASVTKKKKNINNIVHNNAYTSHGPVDHGHIFQALAVLKSREHYAVRIFLGFQYVRSSINIPKTFKTWLRNCGYNVFGLNVCGATFIFWKKNVQKWISHLGNTSGRFDEKLLQ